MQFGTSHIHELIPKLITCEKLLDKSENNDQLKLENAFFLGKSFFINSDYKKAIKIIESRKGIIE